MANDGTVVNSVVILLLFWIVMMVAANKAFLPATILVVKMMDKVAPKMVLHTTKPEPTAPFCRICGINKAPDAIVLALVDILAIDQCLEHILSSWHVIVVLLRRFDEITGDILHIVNFVAYPVARHVHFGVNAHQ